MTVSVIIPSYNGAGRILNTLHALKQQSVKEFEVIVVVDGSTDNTVDLLNSQLFNFGNFKIVDQDNKGRSGARNAGARHANGELLIFYDDDVRPGNSSVEQHIKFHKSSSNSICTGFPIEDETLTQLDIQKFKVHLAKKWTRQFNVGISKLNDQALFLTAANLSVNRDLFDKLGGFNEELSDAEDFELAYRAMKNGIDIYFDKSNIAWHDDFITCEKYIIRQRQYNKANVKTKEFVPASHTRMELNPEFLPLYKKIVFSFFAHSFWVKTIDNERLTWLPKNLRFKVYDWVITGLGKIFPQRNINQSD